jgi:hypothetical protein
MRAWSSTTSTKRPSSRPDMRYPRGLLVNSAKRTRSGRGGSKPPVRPARCPTSSRLQGLRRSSTPAEPSWRQLIGFGKAPSGSFTQRLIVLSDTPSAPRLSFLNWRHRTVGDRVPFWPPHQVVPRAAARRIPRTNADTLPQTRTGSVSRPFCWCGCHNMHSASVAPMRRKQLSSFGSAWVPRTVPGGNCASPGPFAGQTFHPLATPWPPPGHPLACVDWHRLLSPRAPVRSLAYSQPQCGGFRRGLARPIGIWLTPRQSEHREIWNNLRILLERWLSG